jgi:hypothetical protein
MRTQHLREHRRRTIVPHLVDPSPGAAPRCRVDRRQAGSRLTSCLIGERRLEPSASVSPVAQFRHADDCTSERSSGSPTESGGDDASARPSGGCGSRLHRWRGNGSSDAGPTRCKFAHGLFNADGAGSRLRPARSSLTDSTSVPPVCVEAGKIVASPEHSVPTRMGRHAEDAGTRRTVCSRSAALRLRLRAAAHMHDR